MWGVTLGGGQAGGEILQSRTVTCMCRGVGANSSRVFQRWNCCDGAESPSGVGVGRQELHSEQEGSCGKGREGCWQAPHAGRLLGEGEETVAGCKVLGDTSRPLDSGAQLLGCCPPPPFPSPQVWAALLQPRWACGESPAATCQGHGRELGSLCRGGWENTPRSLSTWKNADSAKGGCSLGLKAR